MNLLNSPATILQYLLVSLGIGTLPASRGAWPISVSQEPNEPDNTVTLFDTAGQSDGRVMVGGEVQDHYGINARIRSIDYPTGWRQANSLRVCWGETIYRNTVAVGDNSYLVQAVTHIGQIISVGKDMPRSNRSFFTLNSMMVVTEQLSTQVSGWLDWLRMSMGWSAVTVTAMRKRPQVANVVRKKNMSEAQALRFLADQVEKGR